MRAHMVTAMISPMKPIKSWNGNVASFSYGMTFAKITPYAAKRTALAITMTSPKKALSESEESESDRVIMAIAKNATKTANALEKLNFSLSTKRLRMNTNIMEELLMMTTLAKLVMSKAMK